MGNEYFTDWEFVLSLLPEGWQVKVREYKLMKFGRKFSGEQKESDLLRVLMMHLADGLSLRSTSAQAKLGGLADISDVGILARLRKSGPWFLWCIRALQEKYFSMHRPIPNLHFRPIVVDASTIKEPGATGSLWNFHYAMNLFSLSPEEVCVTSRKIGESFLNFKVSPGDLFFGDRAYAKAPGIVHVLEHGGQVLCRFSPHYLPTCSRESGTPFPLLKKLRNLKYGEIGDWNIFFRNDDRLIPARICAMKKAPLAAEKARKELLRESSKKQRNTSDKTVELSGYILILTTLRNDQYNSKFIMDIYQLRWQIELFFKRLKSILGVGHLPKYDDECAKAYLCGKIFIAMLIEIMIHAADDFFPCGNEPVSQSKCVAGNGAALSASAESNPPR